MRGPAIAIGHGPLKRREHPGGANVGLPSSSPVATLTSSQALILTRRCRCRKVPYTTLCESQHSIGKCRVIPPGTLSNGP
jgi:hypothetical protein